MNEQSKCVSGKSTAGNNVKDENRRHDITKPAAKRDLGFKRGTVAEKILFALAEFQCLGIPDPSRTFVALFSGYNNPSSKGFANAVSALRTQGLVQYLQDKRLGLTPEGAESCSQPVTAPTTNEEMHDRLLGILSNLKNTSGGKCRQLFEQLNDGESHGAADVALALGYTNKASKGFTNVVSRMSSIGILQRPKKGEIQLTKICFPFDSPMSMEM